MCNPSERAEQIRVSLQGCNAAEQRRGIEAVECPAVLNGGVALAGSRRRRPKTRKDRAPRTTIKIFHQYLNIEEEESDAVAAAGSRRRTKGKQTRGGETGEVISISTKRGVCLSQAYGDARNIKPNETKMNEKRRRCSLLPSVDVSGRLHKPGLRLPSENARCYHLHCGNTHRDKQR